MRNRNHRPVEMLQIFLQNHQRFNIQIVRRFIQKEDIRRAHQHTAKVQSSSFPTRKHRNRTSLHGRGKKKAVKHLGCGNMSVRRADNFRLITNVINHTLLLVHIHVFLREYTDFHRFAYLHLTAVRLQPSSHDVQQCGFAAAVIPDDTHAVISENDVAKILDICFPVIRLADVSQRNRLFPQTAADRGKLHALLFLRRTNRGNLLKALQSCLLLGAPRLRAAAHPFQLRPQKILPLAFPCGNQLLALCLHFQKLGIVRLIGIQLALLQLQCTVCHTVKEIPVMRHHQQCLGIFLQVLFQPIDRIIINMVCRLVQNQQIHRCNQCRRQCHALFLSARKRFHRLPEIRNSKLGKNRFRLALQRPRLCLIHFFRKLRRPLHKPFLLRRFCKCRHRFLIFPHQSKLRIFSAEHLLQHRCAIHKNGALGKIADTHPIHGNNRAAVRLIHPCNNLQ